MTVDEVITKADLRVMAEALMGNAIQKGPNHLKFYCPNGHDKVTPSFTVYADHFYCFGCHMTGRHPDLLALAGLLDINRSADEWLLDFVDIMEKNGWNNSTTINISSRVKKPKKPSITYNEMMGYYKEQNKALPYLRGRGIERLPEDSYVGWMVRKMKMLDKWVRVPYITIPHLWGYDSPWGIKLRRDDYHFLPAFSESISNYPEAIDRVADRMKIEPAAPGFMGAALKYYFPRYGSITGSVYGIYRGYLLMENRPVITAVESELDVLLLYQFGINAVACKPKDEVFNAKLKHTFRKAEHVFIIRDMDDTGVKYSNKLAELIGPQKSTIIEPPVGKDTTDAVLAGETNWLAPMRI